MQRAGGGRACKGVLGGENHIFKDPEHVRSYKQELHTGRTGFADMRPVQSLRALGSGELVLGSVLCCYPLEILNNF